MKTMVVMVVAMAVAMLVMVVVQMIPNFNERRRSVKSISDIKMVWDKSSLYLLVHSAAAGR